MISQIAAIFFWSALGVGFVWWAVRDTPEREQRRQDKADLRRIARSKSPRCLP